jgi:glycosyltransferase involved in cell wall biosynthesis
MDSFTYPSREDRLSHSVTRISSRITWIADQKLQEVGAINKAKASVGKQTPGTTLSVIVPCYNEEQYLQTCIEELLKIEDDRLALEVIIVDDKSRDRSLDIARRLEETHPEITVLAHDKNRGKGAALATGFKHATGSTVAVQDADLEYDPRDLKRLVGPIIEGKADVVFGSRFLTAGEHLVTHFWHSLLNKALTLLSNLFSDLNLTDMETCYKVFRREIIQAIRIEEERFGFEPEIVAKVSQMRVRIFEMGISYCGRTFAEGKKIGLKDGLRALYCIFHYNAPSAPLPIQAVIYLFIGGLAAFLNLVVFAILMALGIHLVMAASVAYILAAGANYLLCIFLLFKHRARWSSFGEILAYAAVVAASGLIDVSLTAGFSAARIAPVPAKMLASLLVLIFNFFGRKYFVFPQRTTSPSVPYLAGPEVISRID